MALVKTTVSSAVLASDTSIVVASATGIAVGYVGRLDDEVVRVSKAYVSGSTTVPVLRGRNGTVVKAHPVTANFICGTAADWAVNAPQEVTGFPIAGRAREIASYSASGAITLPTAGADMVAILNYTSALTMTLADPTKDLDGSILWVVANGNAAHTVTNTTGMGGAGASYDQFTYGGSGTTGICLMAVNSLWVLLGPVGGTLTNVVAGLA